MTTALNTSYNILIYLYRRRIDRWNHRCISQVGSRLAVWSKESFAISDPDSKHKIETAHFTCCQNFLVLINTINITRKSTEEDECSYTVKSNGRHPLDAVECLIGFLVNWFHVYHEVTSRQVDMIGKELLIQDNVKWS